MSFIFQDTVDFIFQDTPDFIFQAKAPWLGTYAKRFPITWDNTNIDSDQTHFPGLINLGISVGLSASDVSVIFDDLGNNSKKIAITKTDGISQIYGEIETWNSSTEKAVIHVSKDDWTLLSASPTPGYFYFDPAQVDNDSYIGDIGDVPAQAVWISSTKLCTLMAQNPSGGADSILDSTSFANHGTPSGSMTSGDLVDGLTGKAIEFDGTDDKISIGDTGGISGNQDFSVESFFQIDGNQIAGIVAKFFDTNDKDWGMILRNTDRLAFVSENGDGNDNTIENPTTVSLVNWVYCAITWNNTTKEGKVTIDLNTITETEIYLTPNTSADVTIGVNGFAGAYFKGKIGLVKFHNIIISEDYKTVQYYALKDELITWGSVEVYTPSQAETPVAVPSSGEHESSQTIVLSTATGTATIYVTFDGSDPDDTDTEYTTPIAMFNGTLKAIAIDPVLDDSEIMTETYTIAEVDGNQTIMFIIT